jgi:hypothetical protein
LPSVSRSVTAVHRSGWWLIHAVDVPDAIIWTAVEHRDEVEPAARSIIAETLGVEPDEFDLAVAFDYLAGR